MKRLLFLFIIFLFPASILSKDVQADSLKRALLRAQTQEAQTWACLNLDNYYRNILHQDSVQFTYRLLDEGIEGGNQYIIADALRKLVMGVNRQERVLTHNSIVHYMGLAEKHLTGDRKNSFLTEVRLRHIRSIADWTTDENLIIEKLTSAYMDSQKKQEDIYFQIEKNYALGIAAALTISDIKTDSYKNSSRYFDRMFELIQKIPIEYGAEILFWVNENQYLASLNAGEKEKTVAFLEKMMDILRQYQELPDVKKDIYQTFEYVHSLYYEGIAHLPSVVGYDKAYDCLKKADKILRERNSMTELYFAYEGFYKETGDYRKAILYDDSVMYLLKQMNFTSADAACASLYRDQAEYYAALNDYKSAYERMSKYDSLQEKITNEQSQKLRTEMDARYDLNNLELEKERLTSHNRQIALLFTCLIFILSAAWGISQRLHLNKLKRMQKKLIESNEEVLRQSRRAEESEKMKTAFINSICHEIRTPLNAINGFSSLLLDESIDTESKAEFPEVIQKNTTLLTCLLDDMLEVSNLSSSAEGLPTEEADVCAICTQELEKIKSAEGKPSVSYNLEFEEEPCNILTNVPYLSKTIARLLGNANKFTESGQITLSCRRTADGQAEIRITDTGIGVPADKQEWIFERFTKIDDFKPGIGLGLYICRLIAKRLGGTIHIDSDYTDGARFVLILPTR